jgi:hypothetical protein
MPIGFTSTKLSHEGAMQIYELVKGGEQEVPLATMLALRSHIDMCEECKKMEFDRDVLYDIGSIPPKVA